MNHATQPKLSCRRTMSPRDLLIAVVTGLSGMAQVLIAEAPATAQTADLPTIAIASMVPAEPATQVAFPIEVGPPTLIPRRSFVRVRGLPTTAALSDGHSIAPGSWAVPLAALPGLKITLPVTAAGRSDVLITLVAIDGSVLAEARTTLVVHEPTASARTPPGAPDTASGALIRPRVPLQAPAQRSGPPIDDERALGFIKKGEELMASGNVEGARLFYERAADAGLAQGALALAATFDPHELARQQVVGGLRPDAAQAQRWYERALALGAAEAEEPLKRLSARQ